jgi:outer membrane protein OmpA-like peptidoglycan-associated protein
MVKALATTVLVVRALIPSALPAQRILGFGGLEARAGVADVKNADKGINWALDGDLGYLKLPILRTYAGLNGFNADVDLKLGGNQVGGSLSALGVETGVRADLRPLRKLSPYLLLGLSFTHVNASDVNDPAGEDLLDGSYTALDYGVGAAWHLGRRRTWAAVGDLRFTTGSAVGRTVVTAGIRWNPRGPDMYKRVAEPEKKAAPVTTATFASSVRSLPGVSAVREADSTVTIVLDETVFDTSTGGLSAKGQSTVQSTAKSVAAFPNARVSVEGHTDSTGNSASDQRAAEQRAEAVRAALFAGGVASARLTSTGFGGTRPIGDNSTAEGRSKNRRVEIVVVGAKQ